MNLTEYSSSDGKSRIKYIVGQCNTIGVCQDELRRLF